jgi:S-formylglutathione hydrolase FrmB
LLGLSLQDGWLPWLLIGLGLISAAFLLFRPLRWWIGVVLGAIVLGGVAAWVVSTFLAESLFADALPFSVAIWIGVMVAAVVLGVGHFFRSTVWHKVFAVLATIVLVAASGNQINKHFQQYPTLGDLLGASPDSQIDGPPPIDGSVQPTTPAGPLTTSWTPTGSRIPADGHGKISEINIPGTVSGFQARPGKVYYPPAYFADNPVLLPVVVLISGQPGEPADWFLADRAQKVMDDFAATHKGIAPIVVVPDALGSQLANPLCANTDRGQVDTYLAKDVPDAIRKQLRADPDTHKWVFGGFSYGGTCAIQLATNHPDIYPNFVDISGQLEPTFGTRQQTVDAAFNGDNAAFVKVNPMDLMSTRKFPDSAGWFIVGSEDAEYKTQQQAVYAAAQQAGMNVQYWENPGSGHDWGTAVAGLEHTMPWIAQKTGLTP